MGYIKNVKIGNDTHLIEPTLYAATSGTTSAITLSIPNFELVTGAVVTAKMTSTNAANASLKVSSSDEKNIQYDGSNITAGQLIEGRTYSFVYDSSAWQLIGDSIDIITSGETLSSSTTITGLTKSNGKIVATISNISISSSQISGIIDIAHGGTNSSTALNAITNLGGVYIKSGGTALTSDIDIDTFHIPGSANAGTYISGSGTVSKLLQGTVPITGSGFKLINYIGYGSNDYRQFLTPSIDTILYRHYNYNSTNPENSYWSKWYKFVVLPSENDKKTFSAIGGTTTPVYVASDGIVTACTSYAGYLNTWSGSTSIATVGTITTGTWSGTAIDVAHGGTGATTSAGARTNLGLGTIAVKAETDYLPVKYSNLDYSSATTTNGVYPVNQSLQSITGENVSTKQYGGAIQFGSTGTSVNYYGAQLVIISSSGADTAPHAYIRRMTNTPSWGIWGTLLDNNNYTTYTVTKQGGGATGNWNINAVNVTSTVEIAHGGTGTTSFTKSYLVYASSSSTLASTKYAHINYQEGTTTKIGYEELVLGNTIGSGNDNNAFGRIALYSSSTKGSYITAAATSASTWPVHVLPATAGWLVTGGNGSDSGVGSSAVPIYISSSGVATAITSLAVEYGGTGATTAETARSNLGLGSIATETATNYLKWQTSSADSTTLYNFGVYVSKNTANGTGPKGNNYYSILNIPYKKANGHTDANWAWSLGNSTSDDQRLFFRTANSSSFSSWQEVAHATVSDSDTGSTTQPVYMTSSGVITACSIYAGGTAVTLNNSSKAASTASFYAPTTGGTQNTQALVGDGATSAPKWADISPSITIGAGTSAATPTVNVTVLGQSGTAKSITTASTSVYGATKLNDGIDSSSTALAATANSALMAAKRIASSNSTSKLFLVGATSQSATGVIGYSYTNLFATAGALSAKTLGVNGDTTADKVTLQWNSTDNTLDFVFA